MNISYEGRDLRSSGVECILYVLYPDVDFIGIFPECIVCCDGERLKFSSGFYRPRLESNYLLTNIRKKCIELAE